MAAEAIKIGLDDLLVKGGREALLKCDLIPLSSPLFAEARRREERRQERLKAEESYGDTDSVQPTPEPWPELGDEAFHGLAGKIVKAISPFTEADQVAVLVTLLVMFGNCVNA